MAYIPISSGSQFTVNLSGNSLMLKSDSEVVSEMTPYLSSDGFLLLSSSISSTDIFHFLGAGPMNATMIMEAQQDTDADTVSYAVRQAFIIVTKSPPISVDVSSVSTAYAPSAGLGGQVLGAAQSTGQPATQQAQTLGDYIGGFFSKLQTAGVTLLVGLFAVILIVLLIVAFGPNVPKIAKVVA